MSIKRYKDVADYDCVVIGAGPAGLVAAMNLGFEGRSVLIVDNKNSPGGQAGTSHLIENLPGFQHGISGPEFTSRMIEHAEKHGVKFLMPTQVHTIMRNDNGTFVVVFSDRQHVCCRSVILAIGSNPRLLPATNMSLYHGRGVVYGSPALTPGLWEGRRVGVIGGANSAAQAAMFLSQCDGCHVTMLVRDAELEKGMSHHVAEFFRNEAQDNIDILTETSVEEAIGDGQRLTSLRVNRKGQSQIVNLEHVFVQIGAAPHTSFVADFVSLDDRGYIYTDRDIPDGVWTHDRPPMQNETSQPGIFAAGDVRFGNIRKRAGVAIGDAPTAAASALDFLLLKPQIKKAMQAA